MCRPVVLEEVRAADNVVVEKENQIAPRRLNAFVPRNPSEKSPLATALSGFGGARGPWELKSSKKAKKPLGIDLIYAIT
jgi:hypothetical protein